MDNSERIWEQLKPIGRNTLECIIGFIQGDPISIASCLAKINSETGRISDTIFWDNFKKFLQYGDFSIDKLRKLSEKLEEYGDKNDMAIRIIKMIDDIDSEEIARCLANLSQSVINEEITVNNYFRLIRTLRMLVPEDLAYMGQNVRKETFTESPYLDDYIVSGIIREVDGGYVYTERAWELLKYGISRGHGIEIPDKIKERPITSLDFEGGDEG